MELLLELVPKFNSFTTVTVSVDQINEPGIKAGSSSGRIVSNPFRLKHGLNPLSAFKGKHDYSSVNPRID